MWNVQARWTSACYIGTWPQTHLGYAIAIFICCSFRGYRFMLSVVRQIAVSLLLWHTIMLYARCPTHDYIQSINFSNFYALVCVLVSVSVLCSSWHNNNDCVLNSWCQIHFGSSNLLRLAMSNGYQLHSWFTYSMLLLFLSTAGFWVRPIFP